MSRTKKVLFDMDGTIARFYEQRETCLEEMYGVGFFKSLAPYTNVTIAVKMLNEKGIDVGVLSACVTPICKEEKLWWLHYWLPEIKAENIILCDVGQNKAEVLAEKGGDISETILVDDYTKNLNEWAEKGGHAVKIRNELNGTGGTWQRESFDYREPPEKIAAYLEALAKS